jgi:hypothetical protein
MKSEVGGYAMAQDVSRRALMIQALRSHPPGRWARNPVDCRGLPHGIIRASAREV